MDLKRFMAMPDAERKEVFDRPVGTCLYAKCGKAVMSSDEKRYVNGRGYYHDDCYFEEWGEEVEKHPVCSPRKIGGRTR